MRRRPSSRLLILNPENAVLLFRFVHKDGALQGQDYWATPGGGVEQDETFEQAAVRELYEETGIRVDHPGPEIGRREFVLRLADGEQVISDERYFLILHTGSSVSREGWTDQEVKVMADHQWWSRHELCHTTDIIFPENLLKMLLQNLSPAR